MCSYQTACPIEHPLIASIRTIKKQYTCAFISAFLHKSNIPVRMLIKLTLFPILIKLFAASVFPTDFFARFV